MKRKIIYVFLALILILNFSLINPIRVYSANSTQNNKKYFTGKGAFNEDIINSTVWAIDKITYYSQINKKYVTISNLAEAIIVNDNYETLGENCDLEIVTATGDRGWVKYKDRNKLLINLPDVRSDIVYDITNAYKSKFKIGSATNVSQKNVNYKNGYVEIPEITGKKLYTYDSYDSNQNDGKVWNSKLGRYEFVCPVRFDMALKIGEAQNRALKAGYCLKIYDGYRPHEVSVKSYKKALEVSNTNKAKALRNGIDIRMFLHDGISTHNRGVAVDLTMVYKNNKSKEISVMSDIHDLSFNSAKGYYNTEESKKLIEIMNEKNEFVTATYEWWHFQVKNATNYSYTEGQIKYTNLMSFTNTITIKNKTNMSKTVTVKANRPLKTIPSGWAFVKNTNNTSIEKTFSSTTNKHTIEIEDYNNRKLKVEIPEITIFKANIICYIGEKDKVQNYVTSDGKKKTIIIEANMSIKDKTKGWSYIKNSDYKKIQKTFDGDIADKDRIVKITNSKGGEIEIDLKKIIPYNIKITASDGSKTLVNNYNYNTISRDDSISKYTFTNNVKLTISAQKSNASLVYYINGKKGNSAVIDKSTKNIRLTVKQEGVSISSVFLNININKKNNTSIPQMTLVTSKK